MRKTKLRSPQNIGTKKFKRLLGLFSLGILIIGLLPTNIAHAENAAPGAVVINEIAWAGVAASASDEWIELYNTTGNNIDLTSWLIDDDNGDQQYLIPGGVIGAHSYFLIEDSEATTNVAADLIANLSLNNAGDKLAIKDAAGNVIDTVNSNGGAWYAGESASRTTMERVDPTNSNDAAANWAANKAGNGATDRNGDPIKGTPKGLNSVMAVPAAQKATVELVPSATEPGVGDQIAVQATAQNVQNLFSYGFDISYDPAVLEYIDSNEGAFLNQGGEQTSFYTGLENNAPGRLVVAGSRIAENKIGISGDGVLFSMQFRAIGAGGSTSNISIGNTSFLANTSDDLIAEFSGTSISVQITVTDPAAEIVARVGAQRYQIVLTWQAPQTGSDTYKILRKNSNGVFVEIGETAGLEFKDSDELQGGGKLIPNVDYEYRVIAVKNGIQSEPVAISAKEMRGVKGDNNRSDRVDGRDLQRLAQHFAETSANMNFDPLVDTTYDGRIDGNDLIDIGANWALSYN